MKIYVNYESHGSSGGEICAGEENDPRRSYEDTIYDESVTRITKQNVTPYHEEFDIDWDGSAFVVAVRYFDGDTFGRSCGHLQIWSVHKTREEAEEMARMINDGKQPNSKKYPMWTGYFAGIESVDVIGMPIE